LLGDRTFREGFAVLGRLGLSFDAWMYHPQIDDLASLAGAFPRPRRRTSSRRPRRGSIV
jgi:L-fuconolactonase